MRLLVVDKVDERPVALELERLLLVAHPPAENGGGGGGVRTHLVDVDARLVHALGHRDLLVSQRREVGVVAEQVPNAKVLQDLCDGFLGV